MIKRDEAQLSSLAPTNRRRLERFKSTMMPAWKHTLLVDWPTENVQQAKKGPALHGAGQIRFAVILAYPNDSVSDGAKDTAERLSRHLPQGFMGFPIDLSLIQTPYDQFTNFFTTYNRTTVQKKVQELIQKCNSCRESGFARVILWRSEEHTSELKSRFG